MTSMRRHVALGTVSLAFAMYSLYFVTQHHSTIPRISGGGMNATTSLQEITKQELIRYDGSDSNMPIYIGLDGYIYDVTAGKKFYQAGAMYHYLAGKDSSKTLHILGGETIKQKYPIIGILVEK